MYNLFPSSGPWEIFLGSTKEFILNFLAGTSSQLLLKFSIRLSIYSLVYKESEKLMQVARHKMAVTLKLTLTGEDFRPSGVLHSRVTPHKSIKDPSFRRFVAFSIWPPDM